MEEVGGLAVGKCVSLLPIYLNPRGASCSKQSQGKVHVSKFVIVGCMIHERIANWKAIKPILKKFHMARNRRPSIRGVRDIYYTVRLLYKT